MPQYHLLYHYTTAEGFYAVTAAPKGVMDRMIRWVAGVPDPEPLRPSLGEGGRDAFHGPGWYMTDIVPGEMPRQAIATRLWDGAGFNMLDRTNFWLAYEVHHRALVPCRKHVFLIRATSKAQLRLVRHGETPDLHP